MGIMDWLNPIGAVADIGLGVGNMFMQNKNLNYQKSMQQQAWAREDNATQRRVADLKASGLSPTLAAGTAAQASAPIQTHAPQYGGPSMQDKAQNYLALTKMKADIATSQAQKVIAEAKAKEAVHDAQINTSTPGITSAQNNGPLGYIKAIGGLVGSNAFKSALNEMFTFNPPKNAKPSGKENEASKPKNSASISNYKRNNGYSPDVEAWKEKIMDPFGNRKSQPAGGGGGGAW
ncbi:MAG: hypothetical protein EOM59_16595 [Clostridia bacterium]|nr:hypothetical protein [Clostridia bacterium]